MQDLILQGNPHRLAADDLDLGVELPKEEAQQIIEQIRVADIELAKLIEQLKWQKYSGAFERVLGKGVARSVLGRSFFIDVPAHMDSPLEKKNPRRQR